MFPIYFGVDKLLVFRETSVRHFYHALYYITACRFPIAFFHSGLQSLLFRFIPAVASCKSRFVFSGHVRRTGGHGIDIGAYLNIEDGRQGDVAVSQVGGDTSCPFPGGVAQHSQVFRHFRKSRRSIYDNLSGIISKEVFTEDGTIVLPFYGSYLYVNPTCRFQFKFFNT